MVPSEGAGSACSARGRCVQIHVRVGGIRFGPWLGTMGGTFGLGNC